MASAEGEVVTVDERGADGGEDHTNGERDEHETCCASVVAFSVAVDNGKAGWELLARVAEG